MTNGSLVMVLSWSGVACGITIIFLALICFLLDCRYSICWRYDDERGNGMFEMTPTRRRRSDRRDFIQTPPCLCGGGTAVLNVQRKGGRRNNSCPV